MAESVHEVLIAPAPGCQHVTEWAKKQACWNRVSELVIAWPPPFLNGLITIDDRRDAARSARREQRQLNSVQAQIAVVNAVLRSGPPRLHGARKGSCSRPPR